MAQKKRKKKKNNQATAVIAALLIIIMVLIIAIFLVAFKDSIFKPQPSTSPSFISKTDSGISSVVPSAPEEPQGPDIKVIDGVTYVDGILIANKTYGLPKNFGGENDEALEAFEKMQNDAFEKGLTIWIQSGYRSYETQYAIYWREYDQYGFDYAESSTARPGFSEHQTGLAFDLNTITMDFKDTDEGIWCAENAHKYGFILRYPEGKSHITGYMFEPWHFRYVGDIATDIYNSGLTLEEYLGIDSAYTTNDVER